MKRAFNIFFAAFYSFGILILPYGDFTSMKDLPKMYRHCKATEDKDMNAFDFVTDHLLNIDGIFDKHENGDDQKPHQPVQNYQHSVSVICFSPFTFSVFKIQLDSKDNKIFIENSIPSDFIQQIFRPPIFA